MWEDISGYENLYAISKEGKVKSFPKGDGNGKRERLLKFDIGKKNHKRVTLCKNGRTKRFLVHRLVANAFIPNTKNKNIVHHIDHNPENNNINNLMWVTHTENMNYGYKDGNLRSSVEKAGRANRKLSMKDIEKIKQIKTTTRKSNKKIGEQFGVGRECIRRLIKGDTYNYE